MNALGPSKKTPCGQAKQIPGLMVVAHKNDVVTFGFELGREPSIT